jgi:hypothetical protein
MCLPLAQSVENEQQTFLRPPEGALPSYGQLADGTSGSARLETLGAVCHERPIDFFAIFVGHPNKAPGHLMGASVAP